MSAPRACWAASWLLNSKTGGWPYFASDLKVDICRPQALQDFSRGKQIRWLVNCAAYTAVDRAESEAERALAVNVEGVENLARLATELGARVIHFSSDYVFAGDREEPYPEAAQPRPLSRYGWSKWQGEIKLAAAIDTFFSFASAGCMEYMGQILSRPC